MAAQGHPEGPWEQQDGLEMVVYMILFDFGVMLGLVRFGIQKALNFVLFVSGLFPGHLFIDV